MSNTINGVELPEPDMKLNCTIRIGDMMISHYTNGNRLDITTNAYRFTQGQAKQLAADLIESIRIVEEAQAKKGGE